MERELIRRTLEHTGGNRTHSAALLGIGVRTLQRKIRSYGLNEFTSGVWYFLTSPVPSAFGVFLGGLDKLPEH